MTVEDLIKKLLTLPRQAKVAVYESDPDDYLEVGRVDIADNGNQVNLVSQYAVDGGMV